MKTRTLLILAGIAASTFAASLPASAHEGWGRWHGPYAYGGPHFFHAGPGLFVAPRPVVIVRPAPVYYYAPPPVVYAPPAPVYYAPAPVTPNWGTVGGAIAGAAIGSSIGHGNARIGAIAAGSVVGAAIGSTFATPSY